MGQQPSTPSKEETRLAELEAMKDHDLNLLDTWRQRAFAELAAGIPAGTPGTALAVYDAALEHGKRCRNEEDGIRAHLLNPTLPMPRPTPPLQVTLPPLHAAAAPPEQPSATASGVEPNTPPGGAGGPSDLRIGGRSSSTEEGAGGSGVEGSEAVPLLGGSAGQLAPKLRRRQGHGGSALL